MSKKTFDELVWKLVKQEKLTTMVVDNFQAYAIIKDRLDTFWEQVRLMEPDDDHIMLVGALVNLAATAQLMAEGLYLLPEQQRADERYAEAEAETDNTKAAMRSLVHRIDTEKKKVKSLQLGTDRFAYEFNRSVIDELKQQVGLE